MSGIAYIHPEATLQPSKLELLASWLPNQWWFDGDASDLELLARYRFADPEGEVGLDGMIIRSTDAVYHIPVTWRAAALEGPELIGTLEHSDLGLRYCYDAETDPVYRAELIRVISQADCDADIVEVGQHTPLPRTLRACGSGLVPGVTTGYPYVVHKLDRAPIKDVVGQLMGTWRHHGIERADLLAVLQ